MDRIFKALKPINDKDDKKKNVLEIGTLVSFVDSKRADEALKAELIQEVPIVIIGNKEPKDPRETTEK